MVFNLFKKKEERSLGIDIGTSSIKMVEIIKKGRRLELSNYAEYNSGEGSAIQSSSVRLLSSQASDFIKQLAREAKVESREATMSIPMFSGFSTVIKMPAMSDAELEQAVQYEAKKYIPLPLSEVQFEWVRLPVGDVGDVRSASGLVGNDNSNNPTIQQSNSQTRLLIVAVTNEVINKYNEIAKLSGIALKYLELESFSLARSLTRLAKHTDLHRSENGLAQITDGASNMVIDIGARNSTIMLVEDGWPIFSRSMDVSGLEFSKVLSSSLGIDFSRAERIKKQEGINAGKGVLLPLIDDVLSEARRITDNYTKLRRRPVSFVTLSGGSSNMPEFLNYVVKSLGLETRKAEPFRDIIYPAELDAAIKEMGMSFSVAVGAALREFI